MNMRAILIDPLTKSITEVTYTGDYRNIYTHIGADCFDCVRLGDKNENTIYVDDNGLNNGAGHRIGMFRVEGRNPAYLAGRGLILGTDNSGESVATDLDIEELKTRIAFGEPVRANGTLMFLELAEGETANPFTFLKNRKWPIE